MDVKNCRSCGRLFNYMGGQQICPSCQRKLEDKFRDVKIYLDDNPNATVNRVAEDNEVSVKQIRQWIKDERLTLLEATLDGVVCEQCGTPIKSGRYCDKCKAHIQNTLASVLDKPRNDESKKTERDGNKMRFLQ